MLKKGPQHSPDTVNILYDEFTTCQDEKRPEKDLTVPTTSLAHATSFCVSLGIALHTGICLYLMLLCQSPMRGDLT